jgi:PTS system N-acetylglucosamine-specific IIC component
MNRPFSGMQQLGRALMLPIAVLPIAGMLLRLGQPDMLNWPAMAAAGDAIFSNLGLLFAVGVAVGLAKENHGAAGLAALVCYLVTTRGAETLMALPPDVATGLSGAARELAVSAFKTRELHKLSIPVGLLSGITAGIAYNRFSNIELPSYLSFFGGRRFIAIATGLAGVGFAAIIGAAWPFVEHGMDAASRGILGAGSLGLFVYGVLNRVLIVTGLHHILNNFAWFIVGDYHGATGDMNRFFAGDPTAGVFMSGFFPVMMFGLPGACLAMYHAARRDRRAGVAGLLMSLALTSFLTGVTEPIEFTFMFLAPLLYGVHAVATGLAMVVMNLIGVRLGFGFSAGLFDYVLNFSHAQRPLLLLPVGLAYAALYYGVFRFCIARFDLATPGREIEDPGAALAVPILPAGRAGAFIVALGGAGNLAEVEACTTRLRLVVADGARIDEPALKRLGARGIVRPSATDLQVVLGPIADQVAGEIRAALRTAPPGARPGPDPRALLAALGGRANVLAVETAPGRLLLKLARVESIDAPALAGPGVRGVARPGGAALHVLVEGPVDDTAALLRALIAGA